MNARLKKATLVTILGLAGCNLTAPPIDQRLGVMGLTGVKVYPGSIVACVSTLRCDDMRAEIGRWVARSAPTRGPVMDVSFHEIVDERGGKIQFTRSGGGTWLAVVTLADGGRIGLIVGCGIGINSEVCFANP